MKWLRALFGTVPGMQLAPDQLPAPWTSGRGALAETIATAATTADGSLANPCFALSDQQPDPSGYPFAPGQRDDGTPCEPTLRELNQAHELSAALRAAGNDHTPALLSRLYQTMLAASPNCTGVLLRRLARSGANPDQIATLARWLVRKAPDVNPVKFGIALLGQYGNAADIDLIMTVGRHEEFTMNSALAACKLLGPEQAQTAMWNLTRRVRGWARIHMVRKLEGTQCPEIQQWLLREGYRNSRMSEYLAYLCATSGKLLPALQAAVVDERLLVGAGEILQALLYGRDGPAEHMQNYADGAEATLAFMQLVHRQRPQDLRIAASVVALARIDQHALPWGEACLRQVAVLGRQILKFDYWPALVREQLAGSEEQAYVASRVAPAFGVGLGGRKFQSSMYG